MPLFSIFRRGTMLQPVQENQKEREKKRGGKKKRRGGGAGIVVSQTSNIAHEFTTRYKSLAGFLKAP